MKKTSIFLAAALLTCSCELEESGVEDSLQMIEELGGIWQSCIGPDDNGEYSKIKYGFSNLRFAELNEYGFKDSTCEGDSNYILSYQGTVAGGVVLDETDDPSSLNVAKAINFKYTSVVLTVTSEAGASLLNAEQVCGYSAWENSISASVQGAECELRSQLMHTPEVEAVLYSSYKVTENELYLGLIDSLSGKDESDRITSFAPALSLIQKSSEPGS